MVLSRRRSKNREGFSNVLRRGASARGYLGLRVEFVTAEATSGLYSVRFAQGKAKDYTVERQKCKVGSVGFDSTADRLGASDMSQNPKYALAWRLLSDCRFYNLVLERLRSPARASRERVLSSDGSNLANVVYHISRTNSTEFKRVIQYLHAIHPALQSVDR
jgi:predicted ATPase